MGNNLDLCSMLGVPISVPCPKCQAVVDTYFDDYDIDCGRPNPAPGVWRLSCYCPKCEHEWKYNTRVVPVADVG